MGNSWKTVETPTPELEVARLWRVTGVSSAVLAASVNTQHTAALRLGVRRQGWFCVFSKQEGLRAG